MDYKEHLGILDQAYFILYCDNRLMRFVTKVTKELQITNYKEYYIPPKYKIQCT